MWESVIAKIKISISFFEFLWFKVKVHTMLFACQGRSQCKAQNQIAKIIPNICIKIQISLFKKFSKYFQILTQSIFKLLLLFTVNKGESETLLISFLYGFTAFSSFKIFKLYSNSFSSSFVNSLEIQYFLWDKFHYQ